MGTLTTAMLSVARTRRAMFGIAASFFIQAFIGVSWLPRIPEIIDNLGVSFATWGLIVGLAGIGNLIPLLFVNSLINRFGTRPLLQIALVITAVANVCLGLVTNPWVFFVAIFVQNFGWGVYNISVNSHSVVFQNRIGRVILGRFHASWSIGAAISALLTGFFAAFTPLHTYLLGVSIVSTVIGLAGMSQMLGPKEDGHEDEKKRAEPVPLAKTPGYVLMLALGLFCAVQPEATVMDWGAVFAKKSMMLGTSLQAVPYTLFVVSMIVARLSIGRLSRRRHLNRIGQVAAFGGAISLTLAIVLGASLAHVSPVLALSVTAIFWIFTGLASGPQVPAIFSIAGSVEGITTAQAMSRMSLVNSAMLLSAKVLLGAIAQGAGVPFLFAIPVCAYVGSVFISGYVLRRAKRLADSQAIEPDIDENPVIDENDAFEAFPVTAPVGVVGDEFEK
ncbi:MAG: MFS transporter [Micrococcales bacterium]